MWRARSKYKLILVRAIQWLIIGAMCLRLLFVRLPFEGDRGTLLGGLPDGLSLLSGRSIWAAPPGVGA